MFNEYLEISVVICAYTEKRWVDLQQAIQSIKDQTVWPSEIVLVIDHNPALLSKARETFHGVKVVENHEARGLSGARNSGVAHCSGDLVAFMDEDAIAASSWIENLLAAYHDTNVVGVGGEVRPMWGLKQPDWFPEEFNWVVGCSYKGLPQKLAPVRNPIGCNMSFRRTAILNAGGFRNGIGRIGSVPVGCEETELSIRIERINPNSVIFYNPESLVHHKVPHQRSSLGYFVRRCYAEGVSKAQVTHFVGSEKGLSSERRYVVDTLARGVALGIKQAFLQGKPSGLQRALAIILGLALTTAGYAVGKATSNKDLDVRGTLRHEPSSQSREL
jgi:glycosyltransferase involved in cell wall biosynthesis